MLTSVTCCLNVIHKFVKYLTIRNCLTLLKSFELCQNFAYRGTTHEISHVSSAKTLAAAMFALSQLFEARSSLREAQIYQ